CAETVCAFALSAKNADSASMSATISLRFMPVTPSARGYALVDVDVPARHGGAREAGDAAASTDVAVWGKENHEGYFVSHDIGRVVFCEDGTQHGRLRLPVGRRDEAQVWEHGDH